MPCTVHGEGDQAFRAAYAEFKHTFEKRGDHWIPKQASSARSAGVMALAGALCSTLLAAT